MAWRRPIHFMYRNSAFRAMCTRRNVPIRSPWDKGHTGLEEFFREFTGPARRSFRNLDDYFVHFARKVDRMMGPRMFQTHYVRPGSAAEVASKSEVAEMKFDGQVFEMKVDAQNFSPEELQVTLSKDNQLIIKGKHEQRADEHGFVAREFRREINLPENIDAESVISTFTEEGVIVLRAKVKAEEPERVINIDRESPKKD